jgi:leucyl aminopeptidase
MTLQIDAISAPLSSVEADLLVIGVFQSQPLPASVQMLDGEWSAAISGLIEGTFKGKRYDLEWIYPAPGKARRALLVGAGKPGEYDVQVVRRLAAIAARQARSKRATSVCVALPTGAIGPALLAQSIADGAMTGLSDSDLYKDRSSKGEVQRVIVWLESESAEASRGIERGQQIAQAVNFARWLGDEPANVMTTVRAAQEAQKWASEVGIECQVLGQEELEAAGMGSLLSVSRGSDTPPQVVVLSYRGAGDDAPTLGLVGKGVVFDTGGISIKPAADMHYMKYDMCGAATVIATAGALARLRARANVLAVAGLVENMPGGNATRPGDVVRAANGKSIEIINTDAEGRLVLADALDLARKRGASRLVDVATLTGAIKIALGDVATGAMGNDGEWTARMVEAAAATGERLWPLPLYPEYTDKLKSNIADMMNVGGRFGGALIAGAFIQQFVGDTPWVHLDIAGTAWTEKDFAWQMKGATGVMVRTLVELAERGI